VCDDPVFKYKVHYDFGTDEYLELCGACGLMPLITLNTSTATPEQAAGWAAYIRNWYASRSRPIPRAYFMFGNENYWFHELGHMTGEMYVAQLRQFVPPVRAAYPEARLLAIGEYQSGGLRKEQATPWRSVVLAQAADLFDTIVVTRYSHSPDNLPLAVTMERLANNLAEKEADLNRQAQTVRDAKVNRTIGVVEWNYWTRASHHDHAGFYEPNDIRHCLYAAGYLNAFCRLGEMVEVANFYSSLNTMGMVHVHDGLVAESDLVKVFRLYADALPGEVLKLEVDSPRLTEKRPAVDANFVRRDGRTFGFLLNLSAAEPADVTLSGVATVRAAMGLSATDILSPVAELTPTVKNATVTLPPMSLVRLTCEA
jgi:alpha-L-arabinofuranosidase